MHKDFNEKRKKITFICFFIIVCCVLCLGSNIQKEKTSSQESKKSQELSKKKDYKFTKDWVSINAPWWNKYLTQFKGKANIHYLEIGVFEGRFTIWMLENIITHPSVRVTAIDLFPESVLQKNNYKKTFFENIKLSGFEDKVTTMIGMSQTEMRKLPLDSFDIIYIDGSHTADDVLSDAVLAWPLLKTNGIVIFDDYDLNLDFPVELRPRFAIDAFIVAYRNYLEIIHIGRQVFLKKRDKIIRKGGRSKFIVPVGQYMYQWVNKRLFHSKTKKSIKLSDTEKDLINKYIKSRNYLNINLTPNEKILEDEEFIKLSKKLDLRIKTSKKSNKKK